MCAFALSNIHEIERLYEEYLSNPEKVDPSFRYFFEGMNFGKGEAGIEAANIQELIDAYRKWGHLKAKWNPIAIEEKEVSELALSNFGLGEEDLQRSFPTLGILEKKSATLSEIIGRLEEIYCGSVGIQIFDTSEKIHEWLQEKIEKSRLNPEFSLEKKKIILDELNQASLFEIFLHTKFIGQKRFSLEGGETLIPLLNEIIETCAEKGVEEVVIGMPHRGRLNVLTNILKKSYSMVFSEFEDYYDPALVESSGDVKYHKGFSSDITTRSGKKVHISLLANASHLESVDPIVEGKVRAKQDRKQDFNREKCLAILIHGDGAIAGQGVVYETLQLYNLQGYSVGGTLHIILNNQIGFTTLPRDARSTLYPTSIAQAFGAPIFHVNAEDPEKALFIGRLASVARSQFHIDAFIDLGCYRKYGHNEGDEPSFTQPIQYQIIRSKKSIREIYRDQLISESIVESEIAEKLEQEFQSELHKELEELREKQVRYPDEAFSGAWKNYREVPLEDFFKQVKTNVSLDEIKKLAHAFTTLPENFEVHPKIQKLLEERRELKNIDFGLAEHLAFATLLSEGTPIRLAGQDSRRGTFSQRHAMLVDQKTGSRYFPLSNLREGQVKFEVIDSLLSEYAALGFEFGYSLASPDTLVLWEAQYGDFSNGAQIIIDQYLSASEQKWKRFSGLVLLLPHGYEGQGPEHSSARMERFLEISSTDNWEVANPSLPSQYFHLLRRQIKREFRKPLIIFTGKSLLRLPQAKSELKDLSNGSYQMILDDPNPPKDPKNFLICSGKIFFDLIDMREKQKDDKTVIIRLETLFPLDQEGLASLLDKYKPERVKWVQEEPINMGAWLGLSPFISKVVPKIECIARGRASAPAVGSHKLHLKEQEELLLKAFQ